MYHLSSYENDHRHKCVAGRYSKSGQRREWLDLFSMTILDEEWGGEETRVSDRCPASRSEWLRLL